MALQCFKQDFSITTTFTTDNPIDQELSKYLVNSYNPSGSQSFPKSPTASYIKQAHLPCRILGSTHSTTLRTHGTLS